MRSNWDTFQGARQQVLADLQRVSRRANGIAPVVNPEDLGIIRNIIRPALDMGKFGEAGTSFIRSSPFVNQVEFHKQAGFLSDWGNSAWSGLKDIGSGLEDIGVGLGRTVASPYYAIKGGIEGGWGGALKGLLSGPEQLAEGIGGVGGGVASMVPYARDYGIDTPWGVVTPVDAAKELTPWIVGPALSKVKWLAQAPRLMKILQGTRAAGQLGSVAGSVERGWEAGKKTLTPGEQPVARTTAPAEDPYTESIKTQLQAPPVPPFGHVSGGWMDESMRGRQA